MIEPRRLSWLRSAVEEVTSSSERTPWTPFSSPGSHYGITWTATSGTSGSGPGTTLHWRRAAPPFSCTTKTDDFCTGLLESKRSRRLETRRDAGGRGDGSFLGRHGCLVDSPDTFRVEIVRWPAQGPRRSGQWRR